jgi:hypothetical protein
MEGWIINTELAIMLKEISWPYSINHSSIYIKELREILKYFILDIRFPDWNLKPRAPNPKAWTLHPRNHRDSRCVLVKQIAFVQDGRTIMWRASLNEQYSQHMDNIVACRPVAREWICEQRPLLGNGRNKHARNNRAVGGGVFYTVHVESV